MTAVATPTAAAPTAVLASTVPAATADGALFTTESPRGFFLTGADGEADVRTWTPGVPPRVGDPIDSGVVTKLVLPLPVDELTRAVDQLERVYGPGLTIDAKHPDARGLIVVRQPTEGVFGRDGACGDAS